MAAALAQRSLHALLKTGEQHVRNKRLNGSAESAAVHPNGATSAKQCRSHSESNGDGLFLGCGTISNPNRSYHLEFVLTSEQVANDLKKLIGSFVDLSAHVTRRKEDYIVYIKKADYISDILGIIGASQALLDFEGIKVNKSTRGEAQRISNCDNANVDRSLSASEEQIRNIQRIEELVQNGTPVRDGSSTRPVQYEDCCILLAARGDFLAYEEALTARGIPVYADARENLMTAPHIRPLISLLKVIDNPAQDIYLAAAMLGPMFGFTDDDLVRLRACSEEAQKKQQEPGTKHTRMSLYGAVLQVVHSGDETPFTQKVKAFYARLTELRRMARSVPAEQLLEEIFVSTGYLAALGVLENGARRREDARRFAAFCAESGTNGISALVRAIDAAAQAGSTGQDAVPGGARPGCVTIMTIHRSKGLQFPVVFVGDTARHFNLSDTYQPVLLHREYGAGLRLRPEQGDLYKTAAYTALANVHAQETRSEQMRLLYVALTRAQDMLILTIPLGMTKTGNPFARAAAFLAAGAGETLNRQANSFADWLRAALLVHPFGGPLRRLAGDLELPFVFTESEITVSVQEAQPEPEASGQEPEQPAAVPADPVLVAGLQEGFAWHYPAAELAAVPAKVSVTSIVHKAEQTTLERPAFLSKDGLTAAEMGTALHAFLEHADFSALAAAKAAGGLEKAILAERQRQVDRQLVAPEIAEKLDVSRIRRFVEGEAFAKICAADEVLRELAFITALPAEAVLAAQGTEGVRAEGEQVLVQGIADLVLVFDEHAEILDYKTDRSRDAQYYIDEYAAQLRLYRRAFAQRLPVPVTKLTIYSFAIEDEIDVPL